MPQEREIFPSLTVEENLAVAARAGARWTRERIYDLFPSLAERRRNMGNQLSGGEQQMLAIGRALMGNPSLLLMDEPLEGLAPVIVDALLAALAPPARGDGLAIAAGRAACAAGAGICPTRCRAEPRPAGVRGPSQDLLNDAHRLTELVGVADQSVTA